MKRKGAKKSQGMVGKKPNFIYKLPVPKGMITKGKMLPDASSQIRSQAASNTTLGPAFWYSPELTPEAWLLPKSRQEVIKWVRIFFSLEPYIKSIITMHSRYPFSKFNLVHDDEAVVKFCKESLFNENFDILDFVFQAGLSYYKFGEAIPFGNWDKDNKRWKSFTLLDPDLVDIKQDIFNGETKFELLKTNEIKKAVAEKDKRGEGDDVPEVIRDAIRTNKNIPLDSEGTTEDSEEGYAPGQISIIAMKSDPGAIRGTSPIQSLFKTLIYQDKIRLAQVAIADRHHMPIELWTVGHLTGDPTTSILPDEQVLNDIRNMIQQAVQTPPFSIVYTPLLKYEALGVSGRLLSVYEDLGFVENQILVGLHVNKNLILGEGPSFSNLKAVSLQRLIMEYQAVRDQFTSWLKRKVLMPMCIANGFKDEKTGKYKVPEIQWEKSLNYEQEQEERKLYLDFWKVGIISTKTLYSRMPTSLDFETEMRALEKEVGSIFDKGDKRLPKKFNKADEVMEPGATPAPPAAGGPLEEGAEPAAPELPAPETPGDEGEGSPPGGGIETPEGV